MHFVVFSLVQHHDTLRRIFLMFTQTVNIYLNQKNTCPGDLLISFYQGVWCLNLRQFVPKKSYCIKSSNTILQIKEHINTQIYQQNINNTNTYEHININTKYWYLRFKVIYWKYTVMYTLCSTTIGKLQRDEKRPSHLTFPCYSCYSKCAELLWKRYLKGDAALFLSTFKQSSRKFFNNVALHWVWWADI